MDLWPMAKGLATWVPFLYDARRGHTGGTGDARYCYSVWFRHWVRARAAGLAPDMHVVAELGPGDSLGIGLAALLSGVSELRAFDVVKYASNSTNLRVLDELVALFRARARIPDDRELPDVFPRLDDYEFPAHLWSDAAYEANLAPARVAEITAALQGREVGDIRILYRVPWDRVSPEERASVDFVYSQAVLEHVADVGSAYGALGEWVRPGGWVSHTIDFGSHRITDGWDGYRQYSESTWKLVCGARPYLLNRACPQEHLDRLELNQFEIHSILRDERDATLPAGRLADRFQGMSTLDRRTRSMHVIARKAPNPAAAVPHGG